MKGDDVRRVIARLAVAVMAADGRVTTAELHGLGRLDGLGLGSFDDVVREEIERAIHEPIDVAATCDALPPLGEGAAGLVLAALAEVAGSDRVLAPREREVFHTVAGHLGVGAGAAARLLESALRPAPGSPPAPTAPGTPAEAEKAVDPRLDRALSVLGLEPGANRARIEAVFLDLVQRYDPARVSELGPEFAAMAVRRLAAITDAYEIALAGAR